MLLAVFLSPIVFNFPLDINSYLHFFLFSGFFVYIFSPAKALPCTIDLPPVDCFFFFFFR